MSAKLFICLRGIKSRRIIQIGSRVSNYFHFKAARAYAITSSNGMPITEPLSISATRLSTSWRSNTALNTQRQ